MLDSGKKKTYNEANVVTIIGQGTTIVGELKSKGTVRIEGMLSGRIHCDDTIVIQETGRVKADLVAGQIIISGEVEGNVFAHDRLEVTSNGKLLGDITAPKIAIAEGVLFEGKCQMKPPGQIKPPATDEKAAAKAPQQQAPKAEA
ncbi:MAG: polymer-forming cytoskeletal protein [Candidatus Hydrogenedentota bacterium]